ncbi:MAG: adenylyl cyclase [Methylotenera sp.]|nr:adenylyl cyclase [Methylotenera sp.]
MQGRNDRRPSAWLGLMLASAVAATALPAQAAEPDFGPHVHVLAPGMPGIQQRIDDIYAAQQTNHFGPRRDAILLKPGTYRDLRIPVGFFTQVLGLGQHPGDVHVIGDLRSTAFLENDNATQNFWRGAENFSVTPTLGIGDNTLQWAVSQAIPFRRMHVRGNMRLNQREGWSSGGWFADVKVDGVVNSATQQQWLSRNSAWGRWTGSNWNMVFVGVSNPPEGEFPTPGQRFTQVERTPLVREKPYLFIDAQGAYAVRVPALKRNSVGVSWAGGRIEPGRTLPISRFHIARPGDTAAALNAQLAAGKHLLFTPGEYLLTETLRITRPGTVVLGIGLPTLRADNGQPLVQTADVDGLTVAGLFLDAGLKDSGVLMAVGEPGSRRRHRADPIVLHDLFFRIGGAAPGQVHTALRIHAHDTLVDHTWLWRADHGQGVGWDSNPSAHGLWVEGEDVTVYGLFVEHFQQAQVVWRGNGGRVYFYQSELPYDPPTQAVWQSATGRGHPSYQVDPAVTRHQAWGLGIYSVFLQPGVVLDRAIEAPRAPGVRFQHMITVCLVDKGSIEHLINDVGEPARCRGGSNTATLKAWP